MKRFLAFTLGFIIGLVFILSALGLAIYSAVAVIHVNDVWKDGSTYIGDFGDKSLVGIVTTVMDEVNKIQSSSTDQLLTLKEFSDKYSMGLDTMLKEKLPEIFTDEAIDDLLQVKVFSVVNGDFDTLFKSIYLDTLAVFIEASDNAKEELAHITLYDVLTSEDYSTTFANIKIEDCFPKMFPADSENIIMSTIGKLTIGGALSLLSSETNILATLNEGGALEPIGALSFAEFVGDSGLLSNIVGDKQLRDLISDEGTIEIEGIIDDLQLGTILGYTYDETQAKWFADETKTEEVSGIFATLAPKSVGDIMDNPSSLMDDVINVKLGDIIENMPGILANFADMSINDLMNGGFETIKLGDLLGYTYDETQAKWFTDEGKTTQASGIFAVLAPKTVGDIMNDPSSLMNDVMDIKLGELIENPSGIMENFVDMSINDLMNGGFDTIKVGDLLGYTYDETQAKWFTDEGKTTEATGIFAVLAPKTVGDLMDDPSSLMDDVMDIKLGDLMDGISGVMANFANMSISDLMNGGFEDLELGAILTDYHRVAVSPAPTNVANLKKSDNSESNYYYDSINDKYYFSEDGENFYEAKCCKDGTHEHDCTCVRSTWKDSSNNDASGIYGTLCSMTISDITSGNGLTDKLFDIKLSELLGGQSLTGVMANLGEFTINDLTDGAIESLTLGQVIDIPDDSPAVLKALENKKINELSDAFKYLTLGDVLGDTSSPLLNELSGTTISNLNGAINNVYIGTVLGYSRTKVENVNLDDYQNISGKVYQNKADATKYILTNDTVNENAVWYQAKQVCDGVHSGTGSHTHAAGCYEYIWTKEDVEADGINKALVNVTIDDLSNGGMTNAINKMTLGDVLGDTSSNKLLTALADKKISELGDAVNKLTLCDIIETEGNNIFNAVKDSTLGNLAENINNVKLGTVLGLYEDEGIWYTDETLHDDDHKATGLTGALADLTIGGLDNASLKNAINDVKLGDIIEPGTNKILASLSDTTISGLSSAMDNMSMGTVLGLYEDGGTWYTDETLHDEAHKAKGINAKLAVLTLSEMSNGGMTTVMSSLTIGDMIDSDMLILDAESEAKLNIIFCDGEASHGNCSYANFVSTNAARTQLGQTKLTAVEYYSNCHSGSVTETNDWHNMTISDFLNGLLGAL